VQERPCCTQAASQPESVDVSQRDSHSAMAVLQLLVHTSSCAGAGADAREQAHRQGEQDNRGAVMRQRMDGRRRGEGVAEGAYETTRSGSLIWPEGKNIPREELAGRGRKAKFLGPPFCSPLPFPRYYRARVRARYGLT